MEDQPRAQEVADSLGARAEVLPGDGHWWMFGGDQAAEALSGFWDSLPRT